MLLLDLISQATCSATNNRCFSKSTDLCHYR